MLIILDSFNADVTRRITKSVYWKEIYIGGVEEIQKLYDDKKLGKLLDCCERIDEIERGDGECETCGDIKFVPCEVGGWVWISNVSHCNKNGLIRCSMCCF